MKKNKAQNFRIGQNHLGIAVFAEKNIRKGGFITKFRGDVLHRSLIPKQYSGKQDRYLQIGLNRFLGPSKMIDDYINHSCKPNCGIKFTKEMIKLVALKAIKKGEEITWDYSTTMLGSNWQMKCKCKQRNCRKLVRDFSTLKPALQKKYIKLNIVAPFVKEAYKENIRQPRKKMLLLQHGGKSR